MSDIDEIKSRINIVDVVSARVQLKKTGRNFKGLCPFHGEKSPSFIVSPDRQSFHCFGCGKGGSVFDFVMLNQNIDFVEALELLAAQAGVKLERRMGDTPEAKLKTQLFEVNHLASEYYHYLLTKHAVGQNARDYLVGRGISEKSIKTFTLGYSPNDWDGLLHFLRKKGYDEKILEVAGLVIRGTRGYYDRFRGRIMFTLKDHRGNVVGFAGRVLDKETKDAKYINTSETPVYSKSKVLYGLDVTKDAITKAQEAILMEGELDVISSYQAGISNCVAIKGSAVTEDHARLLRRFCERIVFALDSDMAGDMAARRGIEVAEKNGFDMRVVSIPNGKDPDDAARENPGLLKKAIKDAMPLYDYFLKSALSRFDANTAFGKKKIAEELYPIIAKIDNVVVQGHYVRSLADSIHVSENVVQSGLSRGQKVNITNKLSSGNEIAGVEPLSRLEKTELYVLALLFQGKANDLFLTLLNDDVIYPFVYTPAKRILELFAIYRDQHPMFDPKDFADNLPPELTHVFDEAFLLDITEILDDSVNFARQWEKALRELAMQRLKTGMQTTTSPEEIAQLAKKLSVLEKEQ